MKDECFEFNFVKSWKEWDELYTFTPCFYGVELRQDVFGSTICEKFNGGKLTFYFEKGIIQLDKGNDYAVFKIHTTVALIEEDEIE